MSAARAQQAIEIKEQTPNNDDQFGGYVGKFTKGFRHDPTTGEVDQNDYAKLLTALSTGKPSDFESIRLGGDRRLVNPQAGLAFEIEGADPQHLAIPAAPELDSDEAAAEIVENYWMALMRDTWFDTYSADAMAAMAADELTTMKDFTGPKDASGKVTPELLFRGNLAGCEVGPYLSQFMLLPVPWGAQGYQQLMRAPKKGVDFMTEWAKFVEVQDGKAPGEKLAFEKNCLMRNGRDLGQWVHIDVLFQGYFNACLILLGTDYAAGTPADQIATPVGGGLGAKLNPGNPYRMSRTQDGFGTFGGPAIITLLCEVATRALKAVWYQKWNVHRRLRPEAYGGWIHRRLADGAPASRYPIASQSLGSKAVQDVFAKHGAYLLPMAFPEGSPIHPAYGAGHATVAGACVTLLKAMFDGSATIDNNRVGRVDPNDASKLKFDYTGPQLTIGGELNKLAANIAIGRNIAGVHWRTDATASLALGEAVAISMLRDQRHMYNEAFTGYEFTKFDGSRVVV